MSIPQNITEVKICANYSYVGVKTSLVNRRVVIRGLFVYTLVYCTTKPNIFRISGLEHSRTKHMTNNCLKYNTIGNP